MRAGTPSHTLIWVTLSTLLDCHFTLVTIFCSAGLPCFLERIVGVKRGVVEETCVGVERGVFETTYLEAMLSSPHLVRLPMRAAQTTTSTPVRIVSKAASTMPLSLL